MPDRPIVGVEDLLAREAPVGHGLLEHGLRLKYRVLGLFDQRAIPGLDLGQEPSNRAFCIGIEFYECAVEAHRAHPDHPGRDPADPIDVEGDGSAALDRESLRALDEDATDADVDRPCLPRAVAAADHGLQFDRKSVQLPAVPDLAVAYHGDEALCERLGEVRRADGLLIGLGDPIGCVLRHFVDALGPLAHAFHEAGRFRGALGEFRNRGVLLADRRADGPEDRLHALNDIHDPFHCRHGGTGAVAQARDARTDVVCRIAGLDGEGFDLGRDDREALPAVPARAASMVALRARRFVCRATAEIVSMIPTISSVAWASSAMSRLAPSAS